MGSKRRGKKKKANSRREHPGGQPRSMHNANTTLTTVATTPAPASRFPPPSVITDILDRLPPQSLLRFRAVSKSWCSDIDAPHFIKRHLTRSLNTPADLNLIIRGPHLHLVEHLETPTLVAVKQTHPLDPGGRGIGAEVLGSCNGLLAVFFVPEEIAIWNPYTRKHRVLPSSGINFHTLDSVTYGFGYDSLHDDYKLIRMAQLYLRNAGTFRSEVKVYGLKSNSWRRIRDFPYYLRFKRSYGYLASEALHWVVGRKHEDEEEDVVVAFDLRSEECREVELPDYGGVGNKRVGVNVDDLGGKLCMVCNFIWERVDVWVMKEYGVKESWSRVASVTQRMIGGGFNAFNPLVYLESRDRILLHVDGSALVWVDLKTKTAKRVRVRDCPPCFDVWKATPSLVAIDAGAGNDGTMLGTAGKINQESKKDRKKRDDFLSKGFRLVL